MAVAAVTFNGTRVHDANSNTGWGNFVIGGGAPASEAQLAYQKTGAVNKKITSSAARQGVDYNGASQDMSSGGAKNLLFCKVIVSDSFDLNTTWGVEIAIGSADTNNDNRYNVAGSGTNLAAYNDYPVQGGYLLTSIDPNITAWREATNGTINTAAITWFAVGAQFVTGAAKTENVAMDAIDVGTGLTITAGDGVSTPGNFTDFVAFDQDIDTNRYGVVSGGGDAVRSHGLLTIGGAAVTEFDDSNSVVVFPDGYHSAGLVGAAVDMGHASSIVNIASLLIGEGTVQTLAADDTRPDFTQTGALGTFDCSATMRNHRNIEFSSIADVLNADLECELLTQNSSNISNSTIRTNAQTSIACLQDPTFGTTTDLHDVEFIQSGAGHAIEISTATSFTLTNLDFTGYGADTTDSAAIDVTASSGTVTLNIIGGTTPTFKTAGATVDIVANPVTTKITVTDSTDNSAVQGAAVKVKVGNTASGLPFEDVITITRVGSVATAAHTAHGLSTSQKVEIEGAVENEYNRIKTITVVDANSYTFAVSGTPTTPATGTILSTALILDGLTDALGEISDTRTLSVDQSYTLSVKKGSGLPVFVGQDLSGTISKDTGLDRTVSLIPD